MTNQTQTKPEEQPNRAINQPINNEIIREELVKTAVNFLLNPRVIDSPLTQKRTFLLKKGLSLDEIDVAIDRCTRLTQNRSQSQAIAANNYSPLAMSGPPVNHPSVQPMPSFMVRSTRFISNATLFSGFLYGAYVFYKQFIEPLIFQEKRKPHPFVTIQLQLDHLSQAMAVLQNNMSSIESIIKKQIEEELRSIKTPEDITLHELKSELASVKALLVNRRQFSSTPVGSIPTWQLNDKTDNKETNKFVKQNDNELEMNGSDKSPNASDEEQSPIVNGTNGSLGSMDTEIVSKTELQD